MPRLTAGPFRGRTAVAMAVILLTACSSGAQRAEVPRVPPATATAAAAQLETLIEGRSIPGAAAAVAAGGHVVWEHAAGVTSLESRAPVQAHTRFRVGSLTKLLTVAALLRLADRKRVALDDPVQLHLPDFPHGGISLAQLAGHLSGIRHYGPGEFLNRTSYTSAADSLRKFAADPLLHPPGTKYLYSSYAYNVLGAVIERHTGRQFADAMRELVFEPAGMRDTSFAPDSDTAAFYDASERGPVAAPEVDLSDRLPAGAAVTTAGDLARFLAAVAGPGFLSQQARNAMITSLQTADGKPTGVGLGWRIATDDRGRTYVHHGGAVTGGRAAMVLYPREGVGAVIVTNLGFAKFDEREVRALAARFLDLGPG